MSSLLRKTLLLGVGTFSLTKEKAEKVLKELVEKGEASTDEAKEFVDEIVQKGQTERAEMEKFVGKEFQRLRSELGLITIEEYKKLEARVNELEKRLPQTRNEE